MALIGAMSMLAPAHAETAPPAKAPEGKRLTGKVTPERVNEKIEESGRRSARSKVRPRASRVSICSSP
jgi:hypothetical protein